MVLFYEDRLNVNVFNYAQKKKGEYLSWICKNIIC